MVDGHIVDAQEERFTCKEYDASFPEKDIEYCLSEAVLVINDVDCLNYYDKPLIKFERFLEEYLAYVAFGVRSFVTAMQIWFKEKLFLKDTLRNNSENI